jgi:hypothetical protein
LSADAAGAQAGDVRNYRRAKLAGVVRQVNRAQIVGALAVLPGQIVVAVNEGDFAEQLANFRQGGGVRFRHGSRVGGDSGGCDHREDDCSDSGAVAHIAARLALRTRVVKQ